MKRTLQIIMLSLSTLVFGYMTLVAITYFFPIIVDFDDAFFFINMLAVPVSSLIVAIGSLICARGSRVPSLLKVVSIAAILFWSIFLLLVFWVELPYFWLVFQYQALALFNHTTGLSYSLSFLTIK